MKAKPLQWVHFQVNGVTGFVEIEPLYVGKFLWSAYDLYSHAGKAKKHSTQCNGSAFIN